MKLKHAIVLNDEEVSKLFDIVMNACLTMYPTPEAQAEGIAAAKVDFETLLNRYAHKAFKFGKKLGKTSAKMKQENPTAPTVA